MQMGERGGEAGPSVDLGKEIGDPGRGQAGVERRERRLGVNRRDGLQRRDPHSTIGEQDVLQGMGLSLAADVRKTSVQERPAVGEPGGGRSRRRDRQRVCRLQRREQRARDELVLDGSVSAAALDPDVAGAQAVAELHIDAEGIELPIRSASDPSPPALPDEGERRVLRQLSQETGMQVAQSRDRAQERRAGRHGAEGQGGDKGRTDAAQKRMAGGRELDRIERIGPQEIAGSVAKLGLSATLEWVDWFNNRRLLDPIGNVPPAEAERNFYAALETEAMAA